MSFYDRQISLNSQNTLMRATITVKTRSYRAKCLFTIVKSFWSRFFFDSPCIWLTGTTINQLAKNIKCARNIYFKL